MPSNDMTIELIGTIPLSSGLSIIAIGIRAGNEAHDPPLPAFTTIADLIEQYAEQVKELEEELEKCNAHNLRSR